jgi:glycosyltransferase involved in cell wall biosynthesis
MILMSHATGNANVRNAALAFFDSGNLGCFVTTIAVFKNSLWEIGSWLPGLAQIRQRSFPDELRSLTRCRPGREILRLAGSRFGWHDLIQREVGFASIDQVYRDLDAYAALMLGKRNFSAAYCYEDGALKTFQAVKQRGGRCFYDLPIAHWSTVRDLLLKEKERWPDWAPTLGGLADSAEKLERKNQELDLADVVICPSEFVRSSLPSDARAKKSVLVVPFGSPASRDAAMPGELGKSASVLRVLFAGSLSQRKGLADLFAAMRLLDSRKIELHLMGQPLLPIKFYKDCFPGFIHHPPRPHHKVLDLMRTCDVLVLPSIAEGRALVQQEAMACGLPVIATRNAGAEDLFEDEAAGFLVPVGSPECIAEKLDLLAKDRNLLSQMSSDAVKTATRLTWEAYRERLREGLFGNKSMGHLP